MISRHNWHDSDRSLSLNRFLESFWIWWLEVDLSCGIWTGIPQMGVITLPRTLQVDISVHSHPSPIHSPKHGHRKRSPAVLLMTLAIIGCAVNYTQLMVPHFWCKTCPTHRGATQMLRCTHAWTSFLKLTQTHFVFSCKTPLNKGAFAILYQIRPLNRFELRILSQLWQKLPLFLENEHFQTPRFKKRPPLLALFLKNSIFRPLNMERVLRVVLKKETPFYMFFCSCICTPIYLRAPLGPNRTKNEIGYKLPGKCHFLKENLDGRAALRATERTAKIGGHRV